MALRQAIVEVAWRRRMRDEMRVGRNILMTSDDDDGETVKSTTNYKTISAFMQNSHYSLPSHANLAQSTAYFGSTKSSWKRFQVIPLANRSNLFIDLLFSHYHKEQPCQLDVVGQREIGALATLTLIPAPVVDPTPLCREGYTTYLKNSNVKLRTSKANRLY